MTSKVFTVSKYLNVYLLSVHRKVEKQELNHNAPGKHIFRAEHPYGSRTWEAEEEILYETISGYIVRLSH